MKTIRVGDEFNFVRDGWTYSFRRETDDPAPMFECERVRITQVDCTGELNFQPFTFGAEPEWFRQRGLVAAD